MNVYRIIDKQNEQESVWCKIYKFNGNKIMGAHVSKYPELYQQLQDSIPTYTNTRINTDIHYIMVGVYGKIRQEKLFNLILKNCSETVFYYQMVFWFENMDDALLFKLIISTLV